MVFKNYYKILDLETSRVSIDEVKQAYRQAAKKYHPDLNVGDNLAEERIKDINEAYKILSVPASKRKYDRIWNSKFDKGKKAFKNEKNVFFNMFLGNIEKDEAKIKKDKTLKPIKGENIETEIKVKISDAFYGAEKEISIKNLEGTAKTFSVKIPEGIRDGEKIRLIGLGKEGKNGGKNGDLLLKVKIENDKKFKLKGNDIYTELPITPWEAALGTKTKVDTLEDKVMVYIPKGIQSEEKIVISNEGYKTTNKDVRGNLIIKVKIAIPKDLSNEEKEVFKQLREISKFNPRK